jgi:hypothetical protein
MKKRNAAHGAERPGEEFAFDLTPDLTGGGVSKMHRDRGETVSNPGNSDAAPGRMKREKKGMDDVEWGPNVKGHHFSVT